ncbi:MAG: hypothetical protein R3E18_09760 [Sphingomonadaceae bacterium]
MAPAGITHGAKRLVLVDVDEASLSALELGCQSRTHHRHALAMPAIGGSEDRPSLASLDHAVVNAGIGGSGALGRHDLETWRRVMNVNLDEAFFTLRCD